MQVVVRFDRVFGCAVYETRSFDQVACGRPGQIEGQLASMQVDRRSDQVAIPPIRLQVAFPRVTRIAIRTLFTDILTTMREAKQPTRIVGTCASTRIVNAGCRPATLAGSVCVGQHASRRRTAFTQPGTCADNTLAPPVPGGKP